MLWHRDFLSSSRSLAVGHQYSSMGTQPILCGSIPGLVPKQLRFCRNYVEIMPSVAEGVKIGIQECQHQFRGRRWNCTTVNDNLAIFGPVLDKGNFFTADANTVLLLFHTETCAHLAGFQALKITVVSCAQVWKTEAKRHQLDFPFQNVSFNSSTSPFTSQNLGREKQSQIYITRINMRNAKAYYAQTCVWGSSTIKFLEVFGS